MPTPRMLEGTRARAQARAIRSAIGLIATRQRTLPDVPAVAETLPGLEALNWFILAAPAGTPTAVLDRLNNGTAQAMKTDAMRQVLERDGLEAVANPRASAGAFLRSEFTKWDKIVKDRNLSAD